MGVLTILSALVPLATEAQEIERTDLLYADDSSVLSGAPGEEWRSAKDAPLDEHPEDGLFLGTELRARFEGLENNLWGDSLAPDDGYLWLRAITRADLKVGPARVVVQAIAGYARGVGAGKGPADETGVDLLQGFADIRLGLGANNSVTLRAGRELIALGSERLVGRRYGPNIPQAFDGFHLIADHGLLRVDAFHLRPVATRMGNFNDRGSTTRRLDGIYATVTPTLGVGMDAYWLGYKNEAAQFGGRSDREGRDTFGIRVFGEYGHLGWNWEAMLQHGRFGDRKIRAWSLATETSWHFPRSLLQPRLLLRANIASGDRSPTNGKIGTFNPLFPKGNYFGELSPIGPANIISVHPGIELAIDDDLTLGLAGQAYWRASQQDGLYSLSGHPFRAPGSARGRFVGKQAEIILMRRFGDKASLSASASFFAPGRFVRETGSADTIRMIAFELETQI